jgi:hypothetical protein
MNTKLISLFILLSFIILIGCGKKQDNTEQKSTQQTEQTEAENKKADSLKMAEEQQNKEQKVKEALEEDKILNDTAGQWASDAEASSSYAGEKPEKGASWAPEQMTGKPNVEHYADDGKAWAPQDQDKGLEWVKLTYSKAVNATEVRVRQSFNPGAIIKVELIDENGKSHTVWEGVDKTKYERDKIQYFFAKFDETPYKTKTVKITLATNSVPGWNEIDAVQLVGQ